MSIINLALQNAALSRTSSNDQVETALKACSSMEDIRKKGEIVKDGWAESINSTFEVLTDRIQRCSLKGMPFQVQEPASASEIAGILTTMKEIDETLEVGKLQQQHVKNKKKYQDFKATHCRERQYNFQVKYTTLLPKSMSSWGSLVL